MKKLLCLLMALILASSYACAELVVQQTEVLPIILQEGSLSAGSSMVTWPKLSGMADETLQQQINDRILEKGHIQQLIARLPQVMTAPQPLLAGFEGGVMGDILSLRMWVRGPVETLRTTEVVNCAVIDMNTGEDVPLSAFFTEEEAAIAALQDYMTEVVAPGLSGYLDRAELLPLPEQWIVDAQGITFCYPIGQYCTLSEKPGTVSIRWFELMDYLRLGEGTVLSRIGAQQAMKPDADAVKACIAEGSLPGLPVKLGDSMQAATDTWHMLIDPDLCEAGRLFSLEDDRFRGTQLITDDLTRSWTDSVVEGIRSDRVCLGGIITGRTTQAEWRQLLGQPQSSVTLVGEQAEAWRIENGVSDYYTYGENRLRLHCNEAGVLVTLMVTK